MSRPSATLVMAIAEVVRSRRETTQASWDRGMEVLRAINAAGFKVIRKPPPTKRKAPRS